MLRGQLAGLAATMMRILDNCRQATEGMLYVAQWAREARDGAGYTHGMCARAFGLLRRHPRYRDRCELMENIFWGAYDGPSSTLQV